MLVTLVIAAAFFVAFIAMGYFGIQERERQQQEREREGAAVLANAPDARPGFCPLCDAPLRRAATSDQVVFELEHRIDAELRDISRLLRSAPESFGRIYSA